MTRTVILGASAGLGAALLAELAAERQNVWAGARRAALLRHQTREWPTVQARYCNLTNPLSVAHFWEQIGWAGSQVTGLVITAGAQGEINAVADADPAAWWETVATNLYGPFLAIRHGLAHLAPGARIVLCAGGGSHTPWPHYSAYGCAKAGLVRLVETLAAERPDLSVNALAPGFCRTPIHLSTLAAGPERAGTATFRQASAAWSIPLGIQGCYDEVQNAVACLRWLLTDAPPALTGRTISAQHDPWRTAPFVLLASGAGTTQRVKPRERAVLA